MKKMKWERILVSLSTLIIAAHGEDETCGSQDNQKKCPETVNSHLKKTLRSLWSDEILLEQTNQMKAIFDEMKDQVNHLRWLTNWPAQSMWWKRISR